MDFEYDVHQRTKSPLIKSNEELVETLEDNQVWVLGKYWTVMRRSQVTKKCTFVGLFFAFIKCPMIA